MAEQPIPAAVRLARSRARVRRGGGDAGKEEDKDRRRITTSNHQRL